MPLTNVDSIETMVNDDENSNVASSDVFLDDKDVVAGLSKPVSEDSELSELDEQIEKSVTLEIEVREEDLSVLLEPNIEVESHVDVVEDEQNEKSVTLEIEVRGEDLSVLLEPNIEVESQVDVDVDEDEQIEKSVTLEIEVRGEDLSVLLEPNIEVESQVDVVEDEQNEKVDTGGNEHDISDSLKSNTDIEDRVTGFDDQNKNLDAVNERVSENQSEGDDKDMNLAEDFPPLVKGSSSKFGHGSHVSSLDSLDKTWAGVAVSKQIGFDAREKAKPQVQKLSVTSNVKKEVLNALDVTAEKKEAVENTFCFLMKVPRFEDVSLQEQISLAQLQVDEKTKLRDTIQVQIQEKRANSQIQGLDYEYSKDQYRNLKKSVKSKQMEINSLLYVIKNAKTASSIENLNKEIQRMEHVIEHETISLKKEKQLLREIKQHKQQREELLATFGSQDEIMQALEQRDEAEDRLNNLRKELDILKDSVVRAEEAAVEAEKKWDDENRELRQLQAKFRAANDVRQSAYVYCKSLRKKLSVKNKHFYQYKDDAATANSYRFSGDKRALHRFCTNQVENLMQLWNKDDEFRRDYIKSNMRSTVGRLGTLDGFSLGPNEKPPVLPSPHKRVDMKKMSAPAKVDSALQLSTPEVMEEESTAERLTETDSEKVTTKKPDVTSDEEFESSKKEECMLKRDELEDKTNEEELVKAEVEEEETRAELKQKDEEEKEKTRLKRLKKKERKKANKAKAKAMAEDAIAADDTSESCETAAETIKEEVELSKQPQRKLTRTTSVFHPSLRNMNWRSYRKLMWTGFISFVVSIMLLLGNVYVFSKLSVAK